MIKFEEFKYLVENAINLFKIQKLNGDYYEDYYEDVAWDYARAVLSGYGRFVNGKDLFFLLVNKLNSYHQYGKLFPNVTYNIVYESDKEEAILLFLMDWNFTRFVFVGKENLENYMSRFSEAIKEIINLDINQPYEKIFENIRNIIYKHTKDIRDNQEHIATAKILMLLNPNKFIAWDNEIAGRFDLSQSNPDDYKKFNNLVNKFISRNNTMVNHIENYAKEYMKINNYVDNDSYKIRKLLDMIFWSWANNKIETNNNSQFHRYTEKLVDSIRG